MVINVIKYGGLIKKSCNKWHENSTVTQMSETISGVLSCHDHKATSRPLLHMDIHRDRCHFQMEVVSIQQYSYLANAGLYQERL